MALGRRLCRARCGGRPKFKDFILPVVFSKRLSDVFDDRFAEQVEIFEDEESAWEIVREDHEDALKTGRAPIVGFFVPREYNWRAVRNHPVDGRLGEFVTTAMREVAIGDTFLRPGFNPHASANGKSSLRRFDYVVANPMWNQDNYDTDFYDNDPFGRFTFGAPPRSSANWGWEQHILASLQPNGRAAIVLDTGAVSRGSGPRSSNRERDIRRAFVEDDLIEGIVLLPDNLFCNTTAPGIILLLNRAEPADRRGEIMLINASLNFAKRKPKNVLTDEGITAVVDAYRAWETRPKVSRVVTLEDVCAADYNLSPSQFVEVNDRIEHRPLPEILADLAAARAERERADAALEQILAKLGLLDGAAPATMDAQGAPR